MPTVFAPDSVSVRPPGLMQVASRPPCLLVVGDAALSLADDLSAWAAAYGAVGVVLSQAHVDNERTRREHLRALTQEYDDLRDGSSTAALATAAPVWVIASGYGAYLATLLSQRRPVDRMLLHSPPAYPDAGWDLTKAQLDDRRATASVHGRLAANDNLALCAASQYLGNVWIVDSPDDALHLHGQHVDYFHAFSRARGRHLDHPGAGLAGDVTTAPTGDNLRDTVARWLAAPV